MPAKNEDLTKWLTGEAQPPRRALDIGSPARAVEMEDAETRRQMSQQAQDEATRRKNAAQEAFLKTNTEGGVPLDTEGGAPAGTRAKLSFERDINKQAEYLAKQPGVLKVRKTNDGEGLIMRVQGEKGERDVLVDERKLTLKDIADLAGDAPQVAAGIVAAYFTGGMNLIPQSLATAGATAATGAAQDVAVRASRGQDIDPAEIAAARGTGAVVDAAIPLIPGGAKRVAQRLVAPFAKNAGPLEREAADAAGRLGIELSAAQRTGSPLLARAETFASKLPGGGALVSQREAQDNAIREAQELILGGKLNDVPTEQAVADAVQPIVAAERETARSAAASERTAAADAAQKQLISAIDSGVTPTSVQPSEAGGLLRKKVSTLRDQFKAQSRANYDEVYNKAGGEFVEVPLDAVKTLLDEIRENTSEAAVKAAPGIRRVQSLGNSLPAGGTKTVASPILDQFGQAIMQQEKLPNGLPLNQVIELRSLINDQIGRGEAIGSIPDRYLKRLAGALTESIEGAVNKVENAEVKTALKRANAYYRENVPKFEQRGVSELFAEETGAGFVDDSRIVRRVFDGQGDLDLLKRYESLLGPGSSEYKALVRSGVNRIIQDSTPLGEKFIDAGSFLQRLRSMDPEVRQKVFGGIEPDLVNSARLLEVARGKKVNAEDLQTIMTAGPKDAAKKLQSAITKEEAYDRAYNTRLIRQLTDGTFDGASLNPDEFVSRFVENASAMEARRVMTMVRASSPEAAEAVRRRTIANILNKAGSREVKPEDAVNDSLGNLGYESLLKTMRADREKLTAIVGKDTMDQLADLTKVEAVRAKAAEQGGMAGQLVYSNILAALMSGEIKEVPRIIKNRVVAAFLTAPGTKQWLAQTTLIPATPAARTAVFASPPILRALAEEFSEEPDKLGQFLDAIAFGPDAQRRSEPSEQESKMMDFLRQ